MRRSSRSKSHKQSKHKEYSDSEEDVKMKEKNVKDLPEKRKLTTLSKEGKEGKDLSSHGNGEAAEEYVASKRRKEKTEDRWNGGVDERGNVVVVDVEKSSKAKDAKGVDVEKSSKSKSSRSSVVEKEDSKGGSRAESKRKLEKENVRKESKDGKELKELKDKEKKDKEKDVKVVDVEIGRKQVIQLAESNEEKRGKDDKDSPIQDELRNPELEKELEKRIKRRGDGSSDKDKYPDDIRDNDDRRVSSKGDRVKDGKNKDERHKDASHGDKHREDGEKDYRHKEDKYRDDFEKESRHKDVKYRGDGERDTRHRDDKYREDSDRDNRHRDEKYRQDGVKDSRRKEDKYRDDGDKHNRHREDKYREDGDRDDKYKDDKYREVGDRDRHKAEKHREDVDRDSRHKDGKQGDDIAREKRAREVKYRDEHTSRHRTSESDSKRLREESKTGDPRHRKASTRDGSPVNDDRISRYKDDKGRSRAHDIEEQNDIRPRSTKEQHHPDTEKRSMSSVKLELSTDKGRSVSRTADVDITTTHSRRRNSPNSSSQAARDHYRGSNHEESNYRDYGYEERVRHTTVSHREYAVPGSTEKISSSRSLEKSGQKDDSHLGELSAERRLRSEARGSPLHLVDKSPSSTSNDRRHMNRPDVRRSLDIEESGHRSGGFKDYSGKDGKGSRDFPMETHPGDELSQADGDNLGISSPYTRTNNFSGNSRSLLPPPPPPFRTGVDIPSGFGSAEDDNRGKSNNRHRRISDPNMGRPQGGGWKGVPSWPSPAANGYMPFQHGQPPVGFHPVMQQFPGPPLYGVRPPMELNHNAPYHIPDTDRFSGHGRPLHGWDANNSAFGDESHMYGRLDWDHHNRTQMNGRRWETSGDMWKGQNSRMSSDMPSAPPKADSARGQEDEAWAGQSDQKIQNERSQPEFQVESINVNQSSDTPQNAPEVPMITAEAEESPEMSKMSMKDDVQFCHVYLSKLDISSDLVQPELYDKCKSLLDIDQNKMSVEDDFKILYMEEVVEAKVKISDKSSSASLFAVINDSVFQKAMFLYKKQKDELVVISGEQVTVPIVEGFTVVPTSDGEKAGSSDGKPGKLTQTCDGQEEIDVAVPHFSPEKAQEPSKLEEAVSTLNEVKMEVDIEDEAAVKLEVSNEVPIEEEEAPSLGTAGKKFDPQLPGNGEDLSIHSANNEKMVGTNCGGPLLFTHISSEAVMPESFESGSVNLSRIHHSPESTH